MERHALPSVLICSTQWTCAFFKDSWCYRESICLLDFLRGLVQHWQLPLWGSPTFDNPYGTWLFSTGAPGLRISLANQPSTFPSITGLEGVTLRATGQNPLILPCATGARCPPQEAGDKQEQSRSGYSASRIFTLLGEVGSDQLHP